MTMSYDGVTMDLLAAARNGKVQSLMVAIEKGADLEARNNDQYSNRTALSIAAYEGRLEIVKALVEAGADINALNNSGMSPVASAIDERHREVAIFLANAGADIDIPDDTGETARSRAKANDIPDVIDAADNPSFRRIVEEVTLDARAGYQRLKEVFNFARADRITFLLGDAGNIISMARESFSAIDDKPRLKEAFDLYKSRGGLINEDVIYGAAPYKNGTRAAVVRTITKR